VAPDLTVYNTSDDANPGSLRHALNEVNAGLGSVVTFQIAGPGPFTITPAVPLPEILRPAVIDATTEPSYRGRPLVILSGLGLAGDNQDGLTIVAGRTTIKGLVIDGFSGVGIVIQNLGGNTIQGNYIGTDASGEVAVPNFQGVLILGSSDNLIGGTAVRDGNLISGNLSAGIQILNNQTVTDPTQAFSFVGPAARNTIQGNRIGTDAGGTAALGNGQGIFVNDAPATMIGGDPGAGNLISGNRSVGVQILGVNASGSRLVGNGIGVDVNGTRALPNGSGVFVYAGDDNTIDQSSSARNQIAFNLAFDVRVRPLSAGPTVGAVVALPASGTTVDRIRLTFATYMDRDRASDPRNYAIAVLAGGRRLRRAARLSIVSATYNGIYRTVELALSRPIPWSSPFQLVVNGVTPNGLTDTVGNFLAGNQGLFRTGRGANDVIVFRQGQPQQAVVAGTRGRKNQRARSHTLGGQHHPRSGAAGDLRT
jgi:hypothetical protein